MTNHSYALLLLFISNTLCFAQSDLARCDQYSINIIEEDQCLPGAFFKLGFNDNSYDVIARPADKNPTENSYEDFVWSTSQNLLTYQLEFNEDSTEITVKNLFDTKIRKVYLDIKLSDEESCQYALDIQAKTRSNIKPTESNTSLANPSDSINIDFTPAGEQCSVFNFSPKNYNNDSLQDNYTYEWSVIGPNGRNITALGLNESAYYPLELDGSYDLYVKVIKPIDCGKAFVYRDRLLEDFVTINGNMELKSELDFLCLDPKTKYPLSIKDFSPILNQVDTSNAGFSWNIYRKRHNLRGNGIAYSAIYNDIPLKTNSSKDSVYYQFTEAGDYLVVYNINIVDGCTYSDQETFNIGVYPQFIYPRTEIGSADFEYFPSLCSGKNSDVFFSFESTSYIDIGSKSEYKWYSSNPNVIIDSPNEKNTDIAFRHEGEYELTLQVENNYGCVDNISKQIRVENAKPDGETLALTSSVINNEFIDVKIDSTALENGYYYELDRWDAYNNWIESYSRFDSLNFIDKNVGVGSNNYLYQANYLDYCGNKVRASNKTSNILLEGVKSSNQHQLTWSPYEEWSDGIKNYQVQRLNQVSNTFETLQEVSPSDTSMNYQIEPLVIEQVNSAYCYRIQANLLNDTSTIVSNTKCFTPALKNYFPTAFTPNNDGINDVFKFGGAHAKSLKTVIYSKWGNAVFSSDKSNFEWDGMDKNSGELCQQGVYIVKYELVDYNGIRTSDYVNLVLLKN
jgi:gliding motility-associated-like protein